MNTNEHENPPVQCLICENSRSKRGLCSKHYEQFRRRRDSLVGLRGEEIAIAWENELVANKKLLPNRQGNRAIEDPFGHDLEVFLAEIDKVSKKHAVKESVKQQSKTTKKKQA